MKMIKSRENKASGGRLRLLFVLTITALLGAAFSASGLACHKNKPHGKDAPENCEPGEPGDTTDTNTVKLSNLARASFLNFGGDGSGGISADGLDTCTISKGGLDVTYDYWAWQERLLSDDKSILDIDGVPDVNDGWSANGGPCVSYDNRSDVSGGGRWFLMTTAGEVPPDEIERWLVVDFTQAELLDGVLSKCPDIDDPFDPDGIYNGNHGFPGLETGIDGCVDKVSVWLGADRILKNSANRQALEIKIRHRPDDSDYWVPYGSIIHVNPLYLRDPHPDGPFGGRKCRVMSTRSSHEVTDHEVELAELSLDLAPGQSEVVGRYNLPLEVCVIRASD